MLIEQAGLLGMEIRVQESAMFSPRFVGKLKIRQGIASLGTPAESRGGLLGRESPY